MLPPIRVAILFNVGFNFGRLISVWMRFRELLWKWQLLAQSFNFFIGESNVYIWQQLPQHFLVLYLHRFLANRRVLRKHSHQMTSFKESIQCILLNLPVSWPSKIKSSIIFKSAHKSQCGWIPFEHNRFLTVQPAPSCGFFLNRFPVWCFNLIFLYFFFL